MSRPLNFVKAGKHLGYMCPFDTDDVNTTVVRIDKVVVE